MADYPISNVPRRVQYVNSGVGPYAFAFEVLTQTDIAVYRGSTKLTLTTDYTVTINANGTGSVTLVAAGTGNITIVGARAIQRSSDYTTGGDLFASTLNTDLDSQTIFSQQLAEDVDLSIKVPVYAPSSTGLTVNPEANKVLGWDSTGTSLINIDAGSLASIATYATAYADVFVSNGVAVAYTLSRNPGSLYNLDISVDGVTQEPVRDYSLLDTVVTFTSAMPINSRIVIKYKEGLPNVSGDSQDIRYVPAGIGAVTTTVQAKLRQIVSVIDFGADPTGVADSYNAFANAINTNKTVYIPSGTYLINSPIYITNPTQIVGSGLNLTSIYRGFNPASDTEGLFNFRGGSSGSGMSGMVIRSKTGQTAGCLLSIVSTSSTNLGLYRFDNMDFTVESGNSHKYTIYMDGTAQVTAPIGIRGVDMTACNVFGGTTSTMYISGVLKFSFVGGGCYPAGGAAGSNVVFTGTSAVQTQSFQFLPADCSCPISFDYATLGFFGCGIMGAITNTANTSYISGHGYSASVQHNWTNSYFFNPQTGITAGLNAGFSNKGITPAPGTGVSVYGGCSGSQTSASTNVGQVGTQLTTSCANTQTYSFTCQSGKPFVISTGGGAGLLAFADYKSTTITLISNPSSEFQASSTPGAGYTGIFKSANSHDISIKNNTGSTVAYGVCVIGSLTNSVTNPAQGINMTTMYRKHGEEFVVDINNVWPLIPITDEAYQEWLKQGNQPLEQDKE